MHPTLHEEQYQAWDESQAGALSENLKYNLSTI